MLIKGIESVGDIVKISRTKHEDQVKLNVGSKKDIVKCWQMRKGFRHSEFSGVPGPSYCRGSLINYYKYINIFYKKLIPLMRPTILGTISDNISQI